jgi:hypothetical protein
MFDGVMIEVYPAVTCLDAGLRIAVDGGAVVGTGIAIQGAPVADVTLSGTVNVYSGVAVTRAAVQALAGPSAAPVGSIFIGQGTVDATKPNMYIKNTSTSWVRIVTQDTD